MYPLMMQVTRHLFGMPYCYGASVAPKIIAMISCNDLCIVRSHRGNL